MRFVIFHCRPFDLNASIDSFAIELQLKRTVFALVKNFKIKKECSRFLSCIFLSVPIFTHSQHSESEFLTNWIANILQSCVMVVNYSELVLTH